MAYETKSKKRKEHSNYEYAGSYKSGEFWNRKGGGWIYLYNKGWFRDKEKSYVVSTSLTGGSNPEDRKNISFETKEEAMKYIKNFKEHN